MEMKKSLIVMWAVGLSVGSLLLGTANNEVLAEETAERRQFIDEFNRNNPVRAIDTEVSYDESERLLIKTRALLPEIYNVDGSIGTPVKMQGQYNCWAYASAALAEHNAFRQMNGVVFDFSDDYIDYLGSKDSLGTGVSNLYANGLSWGLKSGGNFKAMVPFYLQGQLPIAEESFKRPDNYGAISLSELTQESIVDVKSSVDLGFMGYAPISSEKRSERIASIKSVIHEYGAVSYSYNTMLQGYRSNIYNTEMNGENHQVVLIGWDDSYDKTHFTQQKGDTVVEPEIDGAFIMKNSWGGKDVDGKDFYYHVSYDDAYLKGSIEALGEVGAKEYDYAYIPGNTNYGGTMNASSVYEVFNKNAGVNELLTEVSVSIGKIGVDYEIYLNPDGEELNGMTLVYSGTTKFNNGERAVLSEPVPITATESFALVVKTADGKSVPFKHTRVSNEILSAEHKTGQYSSTSTNSSDLTSYHWENYSVSGENTDVPRVQAYTKKNDHVTGQFGTAKWIWTDETQTLTFLGGEFPETNTKSNIYTEIEADPQLNSKKIKHISFADPVTAASNSSFLFSGLNELESVDALDQLDVSQVTTMQSLFSGCKKLVSLDVSAWDTSKVTSMLHMFFDCQTLTEVNATGWNTSSVRSMRAMFKGCYQLRTVDASDWDTSNVGLMDLMFYQCYALEELDVSGWDTSRVSGRGMEKMFYYCKSLKKLDVSNWNVDKITSMDSLFGNCNSLESLNVSTWNTQKVTTFYGAFSGCEALTELDVSNWNTSNATTMYCMFWNCRSLKELDVANFDTSQVTNMGHMFNQCLSVRQLDVSSWDTHQVKSVHYMFSKVPKASIIGVSNWNLENVEDRAGFDF